MSNRPSTQADDEDLRLDAETRKKLVAVVVDANAYGKVGPDLKRLANLAADLAKIGIKLWVPEPVAWEWAEHLSAQWVTARKLVNDQLRHLTTAGLPASSITPSYATPEVLVSEFLRVLAETPHVEIVELTGKSAVKGLKDQILQRKPAKTKSNEHVKTGGSDSAWLRDVVAKAGASTALLFLSKDADIKCAYSEWGYGTPLMREPKTVRATLFEDVEASVEDQWLVARYLAGRMPLALDGVSSGEQGQLVGSTLGLLDAVGLDWEDHDLLSGSLTKLNELVGLVQVKRDAPELHEPGQAPPQRTVRANAWFLAEAEVAHVSLSFDEGDATTERVINSDQLAVRTTLVFTVRDGQVVDVQPDSETQVFPMSSRYRDNWDAAEDIFDVLECIPGLEFPANRDGDWGDCEHEIAVEGTKKQVVLSWSCHREGELRVSIGADFVHVTCEYDGTALAGNEYTYDEPPYFLEVETDHAIYRGEWPLASWVFRRLLERETSAPR